tara:strand:- start:1230 stop:2096 length:867 start_codon:yes stop_codon:yes gene_type:complete
MTITDKHKQIVDQVKKVGIARSNVQDIFNAKELEYFNSFVDYYNNEYMANPKVIDRINRIASGNPIQNTSQKWYEITQYEHLNRGLTLKDGNFINLYISDTLVDMATYFYGEPPKLRNLFTYIHPQNPAADEFASQKWHRDPEDFKIFKAFIYLGEVKKETGAMSYIKHSQFGGINQNICDNLIGNNYGRGWHFHYEPRQEDVDMMEGKPGDIFFVNTHGLHKGGFVKQGIRCMTVGCYLSPDSHAIIGHNMGGSSLKTINGRPQIMEIDYDSDEFKSLSDKQKFILN